MVKEVKRKEREVNVFKALSSEKRVKILEILLKGEKHISGLARELGISVPVASKHINVLENAGLIERRKYGRTHVLKANEDKLSEIPYFFEETFKVESKKGKSVIDILKRVSGIDVKKIEGNDYITSVNGDYGYYVYEVNGELPDKPMNKYRINKDSEIKLKKLVPITQEKIEVEVKKQREENNNG